MKKLFFLSFILAGLSGTAQKNVLFIAVDDLKPMIGAYGDPDILTPNLDALASQGTLFANASCQQAICAPSRASLLTGLYPDQTRVWDLNTQIRDENPDILTLPQHFKNEGYHSVGLGKIFDNRSVDGNYDGVSWSTQFRQTMQSQYYYNNDTGQGGYQDPAVHADDALYDQYIVNNNITTTAAKNEARKLFPLSKPATEGNQNLPDDSYKDGARVNYAFEKLDEAVATGKPFFLAVGFSKPHLPFVAPKSYWDLYNRNDIQIHPEQGRDASIPSIAFHNYGELVNNYSDIPLDGVITEDKQKELIHGYRASVSYIDALVGKLLNKLDELSLSDNTIVVLWGDHGWHLGDHGLWAKHSNFEQAVRSPLMIYDPDHGLEKNITEAPVEFVDLFPTLTDLAGIATPDGLSGESLKPIMVDPNHRVRDAALGQYTRTSNSQRHMGYTLRNERYRYTKWIQMDYYDRERYGPTVATELYDYDSDPHETLNLVGNAGYTAIIDEFEFLFKKRNVAQNTPSSFLEIETCGTSYTAPDNQVYTQNGIYTATLQASNGMDSVITIQLTFGANISNQVTESDGILTATEEGATYQWYNCRNNLPISGATSQSFKPKETGSYYVEITQTECGTVSSECVSVIVILGAIDFDETFSVYPNPVFNGILNVDWYIQVNKATIKLFDLSGKLIMKEKQRNSSSVELGVSHLSGTYLMQLSLDDVDQPAKKVVIW